MKLFHWDLQNSLYMNWERLLPNQMLNYLRDPQESDLNDKCQEIQDSYLLQAEFIYYMP